MKILRRFKCRAKGSSSASGGDDDPGKRPPPKRDPPSDKPGWEIIAEKKAEKRRQEEAESEEEKRMRSTQTFPDGVLGDNDHVQDCDTCMKDPDYVPLLAPQLQHLLAESRRDSLPTIDFVVAESTLPQTSSPDPRQRTVKFLLPVREDKDPIRSAPLPAAANIPVLVRRKNRKLPAHPPIEYVDDSTQPERPSTERSVKGIGKNSEGGSDSDSEIESENSSNSEPPWVSDVQDENTPVNISNPQGKLGNETGHSKYRKGEEQEESAPKIVQAVEALPGTSHEPSVATSNSSPFPRHKYQTVENNSPAPEGDFGADGAAPREILARKSTGRGMPHEKGNYVPAFCPNCGKTLGIMNPRLRAISRAGLNVQKLQIPWPESYRGVSRMCSVIPKTDSDSGEYVDMYGASPPGVLHTTSQPRMEEHSEDCRNCFIHCDTFTPPPPYGPVGDLAEWLRKAYQRYGKPLIPPDPDFFRPASGLSKDSFTTLRTLAMKNKQDPWLVLAKSAMEGPRDYDEAFEHWRAATMFLFTTNHERMRVYLETMQGLLNDLEIEEPPPSYSDYQGNVHEKVTQSEDVATEQALADDASTEDERVELPAAEIRPEVPHNSSGETIMTQASSNAANDLDETDNSSVEGESPSSVIWIGSR